VVGTDYINDTWPAVIPNFHPSIAVPAGPEGTGIDPALILHRSWGNLSQGIQGNFEAPRRRATSLGAHGFVSKLIDSQALLTLLARDPFADGDL